MRRLMLAGVLALSGCVAPEPAGRAGWRDPAVAISSSSVFDAARFAGTWHVVAAYGEEARCGRLREEWQAAGGGYAVRGTGCAAGRRVGFATRAVPGGLGRVARAGRAGTEELWILWVDADYRVAAIGTPSGQFGRILSRDPQPRADLLKAAREVLDFNGYDISRLDLLR